MSTTTANPTRTEPSAPCSWVDIKYPDVDEFSAEEWVRIAGILKRATVRDPATDVVSVIRDIQAGDAQLWCLVDPDEDLIGAAVTRVLEFQTGYRSLLIQLVAMEAGTRIELACWRELLTHIEGVGRMLGCDTVRTYSRKGWAAVLENYTEPYRVFEMRLQEVH